MACKKKRSTRQKRLLKRRCSLRMGPVSSACCTHRVEAGGTSRAVGYGPGADRRSKVRWACCYEEQVITGMLTGDSQVLSYSTCSTVLRRTCPLVRFRIESVGAAYDSVPQRETPTPDPDPPRLQQKKAGRNPACLATVGHTVGLSTLLQRTPRSTVQTSRSGGGRPTRVKKVDVIGTRSRSSPSRRVARLWRTPSI